MSSYYIRGSSRSVMNGCSFWEFSVALVSVFKAFHNSLFNTNASYLRWLVLILKLNIPCGGIPGRNVHIHIHSPIHVLFKWRKFTCRYVLPFRSSFWMAMTEWRTHLWPRMTKLPEDFKSNVVPRKSNGRYFCFDCVWIFSSLQFVKTIIIRKKINFHVHIYVGTPCVHIVLPSPNNSEKLFAILNAKPEHWSYIFLRLSTRDILIRKI